jgi:NAD(P)-dependent dehydrogenase (short-subunit alcohol dehydrogenase family)
MTAEYLSGPKGEGLIKGIPQRRLGAHVDLEGPLLLLASDAGAYMTGSVLVVDGGLTL